MNVALSKSGQGSLPGANRFLPSLQARLDCRAGMATTTAGVAPGLCRAISRFLPEKLAYAFHALLPAQSETVPADRRPMPATRAFPRSAWTSISVPTCRAIGCCATARWSRSRPTSPRCGATIWSPSCSVLLLVRAGAAGGRPAAAPPEPGGGVPMYRTNIACSQPAVRGPMAVSMRPFKPADAIRAVQITSRFPGVHGAPVHLGHPPIGIRLANPTMATRSRSLRTRLPLFWACGVTPQAVVARKGRPEFCNHACARLHAHHRSEEQAACGALG